MTTIDFGRAAAQYARHRAGLPPAFYDLLSDWGVLGDERSETLGRRAAEPMIQRSSGRESDERSETLGRRAAEPIILDIGTGTGDVALALARRGLRVTGLDPSTALLEQARRMADEEGLDVALVEGRAEAIAVPDASCRLVTAAQCWHWFDRPRAAAECARVLMPGGALVIAHMDFLSAHSLLVSDTIDLVREIGGDPTPGALRLGVNSIYPHWFKDLHDAGFTRLTSRSFDLDIPYTHRDWVGRMVASAGVGGSRPPEDVARFEALLRARLANEPIMLPIPHRVFAIAGWRA